MLVPSRPARSPRRSKVARRAPVLFVLLALGLYAGSFSAPFVFDDLDGIVRNRGIRTLWPPSAVMEAAPDTTPWGRPVVAYSLAIDHALGGLQPLAYRLTNLVVHVAAALFLLAVLRRLFRRAPALESLRGAADGLALVIATLWLVHPLATSVTSYTVQRAEALAALGMLACVHASLRAFDAPASRRGRFALLAGLAACFAVASKESAVVLPLLVLLLDVGLYRTPWRRLWAARAALWVALASSWVLLGALMSAWPRSRSVGAALGAWDNFVMQWGVVLHYLSLVVRTDLLVLDHPRPPVTLGEAWPAGLALLLLGGGALAALLRRRAAWSVPVLGVLLLLAPTSSFVPIQTSPAADHRMYLPLALVLCLGVGLAWGALVALAGARARTLGVGLALLVVGWWGVQTVQRNRVFESEISVWRDVVDKHPGNARAWNNLGSHLQLIGRPDEALSCFEKAIEGDPGHAEAHCNLGMLVAQRGELQRGHALVSRSVELNDGDADVLFNLGLLASQLQDLAGATRAYEAALRLDPEHVPALGNTAQLLLAQGRLDEALATVERLLELTPGDPPVLALRRDILSGREARAAGR